MRPQDLVPCLQCIDCENTLNHPVTFYCGHSICAAHLPISLPPTCPLSCHHNTPIPHTNARDVTLSSIINLVLNAIPSHDSQVNHQHPPDDPSSSERPRKRHKRASQPDEDHDEGDLLSHLRSVAANERLIPDNLPLDFIPSASTSTELASSEELETRLIEELTCATCGQLLYEPLTTPCQHTFCTRCVLRCADELSICPLCRTPLPNYSYLDRPPHNRSLTATLLRLCPKLYQDRLTTIKAEETLGRTRMPLVQGPLCFPGIPEEVQLTGSKYRLMIRRCYQQREPLLGLMLTPRDGNGSEYGTLVRVVSVETLNNSVIKVKFWGYRRFRVLHPVSRLDGYEVARIVMIDDYLDDLAAIHLVSDEPVVVSHDANNDDENRKEAQEPSGQSIIVVSTSTDDAISASAQTSSSSSSSNIESNRQQTRILNSYASKGNSNPLPATSSSASGSASGSTSGLDPSSSPSPSPSTNTNTTSGSSSTNPPRTLPPPLTPRVHPSQPGNDELMQSCRDFIDHLQAGRTPWVSPNYAQLPAMPTDIAAFTFWVAHSLPLPPQEKAKLLPIRSPRMRLLLVAHWIRGLNEKWWWRTGCVIC